MWHRAILWKNHTKEFGLYFWEGKSQSGHSGCSTWDGLEGTVWIKGKNKEATKSTYILEEQIKVEWVETEKRNLRNTCRENWKRLLIHCIHRKGDSEAIFFIESVIIIGIVIAMVKYKKQKIFNIVVDVEFSFRHLFECL